MQSPSSCIRASITALAFMRSVRGAALAARRRGAVVWHDRVGGRSLPIPVFLKVFGLRRIRSRDSLATSFWSWGHETMEHARARRFLAGRQAHQTATWTASDPLCSGSIILAAAGATEGKLGHVALGGAARVEGEWASRRLATTPRCTRETS